MRRVALGNALENGIAVLLNILVKILKYKSIRICLIVWTSCLQLFNGVYIFEYRVSEKIKIANKLCIIFLFHGYASPGIIAVAILST